MGEVTTHEDNIIERVAIEYHGFDGDEYTLPWGKCKSSYRGGIRKMVRNVFISATRSGLTVVSAEYVSDKDVEIERLRDALQGLLSAPAISDEDYSNPEWGCSETDKAIEDARAALAGGDDA